MSTVEDEEIENLRSARTDFVQDKINAGEHWTDPEFPPVFSSIANEATTKDNMDNYRNIEWKRITDIFANP